MIGCHRAECKLARPGRCLAELFLCELRAWLVTEAADNMIVDETGGLHVRVNDSAAYELETALFQIF